MELKVLSHWREIDAKVWDSLIGTNLFFSHAFLSAMEESGCATPKTGWQLQILTAWEEGALVGGMPLYFKTNSFGEFVFDWAWADAYEQHGLEYYPKLICSVPFTPVSGARLLASRPEVRALLVRSALEICRQTGVSSFHCLFPTPAEAEELKALGLMLRNTVQFHWRNLGYRSFEEFLAGMKHDKRKKINQERRKIREAGITFQHIEGKDIQPADWDFFMECYHNTHEQYNSPEALNLDFFRRLTATMPQNVLLILGSREGQRICGAFNLFDEHALYGRNWGALEYHPGLHFETCYYQALDFCIEKKIGVFEGGAQGEHKLARGFLPVATWSAHWLAHPQFSRAVEDFLVRETGSIGKYVDELNESNPFKARAEKENPAG